MDLDSQSLKPFGSSLLHKSFVCYDEGTWGTVVHSVFGMPRGSKLLLFMLKSARLNFKNEQFRKRIVWQRYGPLFLGNSFFHFNDERMKVIDSWYLLWNNSESSNFMVQVMSTFGYIPTYQIIFINRDCRLTISHGVKDDTIF